MIIVTLLVILLVMIVVMIERKTEYGIKFGESGRYVLFAEGFNKID
jgi:preprotein translocase subunit SecG